MKLLTFLLGLGCLLISFNSFSKEGDCNWDAALSKFDLEDVLNRDEICDKLPRITKEKDLDEVLEFFLSQVKLKDDPDRHIATKKLNACRPTKNSSTLIIAFEGTGAFEPLIPATMASFNKCFGGKIPENLKGKVYSSTRAAFMKLKSRDTKWSGLQAGIMSEMIGMKGSKNVDWYSFPSEEVEQLAGLEEVKNLSLRQLSRNIKDSVNSNPKGIQNARTCIKQYMREAKLLGIKPKIVLTSHSSGGRSLVKFAEHMKKDVGVDVDLAFSIDPVKEAHHAVEDVIPQKVGEPARFTKWKVREKLGYKEKYPYSAVWHEHQPSSLYKPNNVKEHVNFYQLDDREGLKMGGDAMRFGIQGSSMDGADNKHIKGLGTAAHGEITYDKEVLKKFRDKIGPFLK